jgi:hypothetical protein
MKVDFQQCLLKGTLKGRTLWCAASLSEIVPRDYEELNLKFFEMAVEILMEEPQNKHLSPISVKLVATRCINKFSRKVKKEH